MYVRYVPVPQMQGAVLILEVVHALILQVCKQHMGLGIAVEKHQ